MTWDFTVVSPRKRWPAISAFVCPRARSRVTSISRLVSEARSTGRPPSPGGGPAVNCEEQPRRDRGSQDRVPASHGAHGGQQLRGAGVLQQESAGSGAYCVVDVLVHVERGQDQHAGGRTWLRQQRPCRLDAIHHRHLDVHEDDIRTSGSSQGQAFPAVTGLTDHGDVRLESRIAGIQIGPAPGHRRSGPISPRDRRSSGDRQVRVDQEAPVRLRRGDQCPAVQPDSLLHPDEPVAGGVATTSS